ncbi:hypothetical protein OAG71_04415 [bacterium]|nr:hypothetical protein [bacterium]
MFFSPKRQTIIAVFVAIATLAVSTQAMAWQSSEFERRAAAMRLARERGSQSMVVPVAHAEPVAVKKVVKPKKVVAKQISTSARQASRASQATRPRNPRPNERVVSSVVTSPRSVNSNRKPARVAQMIHGGSPMVSGSVIQGDIVGTPYGGGQIINEGPVYENVIYDGGYHDGGYSDGFSDGVIVDGACGCGECSTGYQCGSDGGCCGRGGCPEGPCWLGNFGKALRTGEYFGGATGFQSPLFTVPGQDLPIDENQLASDSSFGLYGGFNLGIPLCRLSCGFLSGQFGVRSVTSNFNGNEFSVEDRRQLFITTGLYRRVDQGLQFGVVADILHEEWFTESDLVQIRSDIGWVYPAGHTLGFRYATGVQDDTTEGTFNGNQFFDYFQTTDDNYRFYYRRNAPGGGFGEVYAGWAEASQTVFGVDVDLPVTDRVSFQSGFTAYFNDDVVPADSNFQGGNLNEAWNLFVGLSFKPQGRSWYRSYDRPLFSVADNGTMFVRRQSPEIQ